MICKFIIFSCFLASVLSESTLAPSDVVTKATSYLKRFGYLKEGMENDEVSLEDAIKSMQEFAGIKQTGKLDVDTVKLMETPRCSLADMDASDGKAKRYRIVRKWDKTTLDYKIHNYPTKVMELTNDDVDRVIDEAFQIWTESCPILSFPKATTENGTMNIRFFAKTHTDNYPFDGPGKTLAHAFYPRSGHVHFDDDETWSDGQPSGTNLAWVATHEFGHALGLGHSTVKSALMYPYYTGYKEKISLDADDVEGILAIYT